MKTRNAIKSLLPLLTLIIAASLIAGCASHNYQKGAATSASLTDSADKIAAGKYKIEATLSALNDLVNSPQGDLVTKFKNYNDAVADLQSTAQNVKARVQDTRASGNEYFKAWDEQLALIKNEDLRNRSAERKTEVQKEFTDIKRVYAQTEMAFKPFLADLKDIQTALGTDLTTGGIASVKSTADKANQDAVALKISVDQLVTQFKALGVAMAAYSPAPQSVPGGQ